MKNTSNKNLSMIVSMLIFGTIGLFVKNISLSSGEIALYRAVLATLLLGAFLLITGQKIDFKKIKKALPLLILSGVAMGFNWILLFSAYNYTTVSVATLAYYFAPSIITLASLFLFKEKMSAKQWVCFIMSTVGIVLITNLSGSDTDKSHLIGILLGLGAACLYACVVLLNKFIKGVDGIQRTFLQFISAAVILAPYVAFTSGYNLVGLNTKSYLLILIVGFVHTGITYCLYFSAIKELPGQKTAILSYIDPLISVFVSLLLLKENITPIQILGGLLILGFALFNELSAKKKDK